MSLNLEQLLQRSQSDDPAVIEALVYQYHPFIYRLALSILDDPDEAEDATQDAFISATTNLGRYRGESSLKTWLYAIALNTCRGHLRKRKARQTMRKTWHTIQSLVSRPPTPEESTMQTEADVQLWTAVDTLGDKQYRCHHDHDPPDVDVVAFRLARHDGLEEVADEERRVGHGQGIQGGH